MDVSQNNFVEWKKKSILGESGITQPNIVTKDHTDWG